jgi:hypothetical protein
MCRLHGVVLPKFQYWQHCKIATKATQATRESNHVTAMLCLESRKKATGNSKATIVDFK